MEKIYLAMFIFHTIGVAIFGKFESESPWWRSIVKWGIIFAGVYAFASAFGETATLWLIAGLFVFGFTFHVVWCRLNGIHPFKATPRRKYYSLRGWSWHE